MSQTQAETLNNQLANLYMVYNNIIWMDNEWNEKLP